MGGCPHPADGAEGKAVEGTAGPVAVSVGPGGSPSTEGVQQPEASRSRHRGGPYRDAAGRNLQPEVVTVGSSQRIHSGGADQERRTQGGSDKRRSPGSANRDRPTPGLEICFRGEGWSAAVRPSRLRPGLHEGWNL